MTFKSGDGMIFGLAPPPGTPFHWDGRATMTLAPEGKHNYMIAIEAQRQHVIGGSAELQHRLVSWVFTVGVAMLVRMLKQEWVDPDEDHMVEVRDEVTGFFMRGNPKGSNGHIYMCAGPLVKG